MKRLQPLFAAPFILVVLMFVAYSLGKSLLPFAPVWIAFLAIAIVTRGFFCGKRGDAKILRR